ncbi:MAG: hypothetical protein K8T91_25495 [Planctomycetes bacterium]|nr:hypothetical protein [Planctomycetota bacterium]
MATSCLVGSAVSCAAEPSKAAAITEDEVNAAQQAWCDGLVRISKIHKEGGDYTAAASQFIDDLYDFKDGKVFFRPTLAVAPQAFRTTKAGALAYFVGGNTAYPHDKGFALSPWVKAEYDNAVKGSNAIQIHGDIALTMGNVYLTGADGQQVVVDKVFAFRKCADGKLRLVVHKSALQNQAGK